MDGSMASFYRNHTSNRCQLVIALAAAFAVIFLISTLAAFHIITNREEENRVYHFFERNQHHAPSTSHGNLSADRDHHAFVCITGQVARMELELKVRNLLNPLLEAGFSPDVALILSDKSGEFFASKPNDKARTPLFASYKDAKEFLEERDFNVVTNTPYIQTKNPIINEDYQEELGGVRMDIRALNHARMFAALVPCYNEMVQASKQMGSDYDVVIRIREFAALVPCYDEMIQASKQMGSDYDVVIRIREDHAFTEPFNIHTVFDELTSNPRTVMTSSCGPYGGMNDRFAILTPDAAYDYFVGPILSYYTKPLHEKFRNAETFIYYTYLSLKLKVIKTPKIFNLQKFRIFNGGPVLVP
eukprot:CAMPEP_0198304690 /NCGR_PEP_ID=MMETSP1449-20131203/57533_1 /TAXON_ID=420275 /ORGANISM="Attheya septentrionalis, Strain CCMP2084" /LENGTH=358 /DNA_ID=CAMNT_0044007219 /DNA_START=30 /DNA_END=1103 /DNA_ORIENTATION=-